jgi:hypothetical protein
VMLDGDYPARSDNTMLAIDSAGVDWLYIAELYGLIIFSILAVALALMFGATLLFWSRYPHDLRSSAE